MQFTDEDKSRYARLMNTVPSRGKRSLADLSCYVRDELIFHCPGSGYRVEKRPAAGTQQCDAASPVSFSLSGAHRTLALCLWSDKSVSASRSRGTKRKRNGAQVFDNGRVYFGSARGLARGKDVHEEIAHFVMWDAARFKTHYKSVDPMTKAILMHLKKLRYTLVHAEYMVYDKLIGAGTAVDLVCLDRAGGLVFVELKTGYQNVFTNHRAMMCKPFAHVADSPLNRARTQLLFAITLYASNHREVPYGIVIHVDSAYQVTSFPMGEVGVDRASRRNMRALIASVCNKKNQQRGSRPANKPRKQRKKGP